MNGNCVENKEVVSNECVNLEVSKKIENINESNLDEKNKKLNDYEGNLTNKNTICDAFVVATGAQPRKLNLPNEKLSVCADKIIKWINGSNSKVKLGEKVAIIGFGDVTIDMLKAFSDPKSYLKPESDVINEINKVKHITVFSRSLPLTAAISNLQLRSLSKTASFDINVPIVPNFWTDPIFYFKVQFNKKLKKRAEIYKNSLKSAIPISLKFNSKIKGLVEKNGKIGVDTGSVEFFDTVISSIGYKEDVCVDLKNVNKPVFIVGACRHAKGNVASIIQEANFTGDTIAKLLKMKK
jgi:hypothetical protein